MKWRLVKRELFAVNAQNREKTGENVYTIDGAGALKFMYSVVLETEGLPSCCTSLLLCSASPAVTHNHADIHYAVLLLRGVGLPVHLYVPVPGPCCVVLAMIHLTRQHFIRDLRVSRGFCHLEPSVCPPGFGSFPLASGSRPPSTAFSFA